VNQAIVRLTPAVKYLLLINGLVYLAQLIGSGGPESYLALVCRWGAVWQIWRFISYAFLHSGALSFLLFALALLFIGSPLEQRLGTIKFLLIYLGSVFTGAVAAFCAGAFLSVGNSWALVIGSGAGILGALAYLIRVEPEAIFHIWLLVLIPIKAAFLWWFTAVGLVVMLLGRVGHSGNLQSDLGGFVFGTVAVMLFEKVNTLKLEKKIQKRYLAWRRRKRFRNLSCLDGGSAKQNSDGTSTEKRSCTALKLLPLEDKEEKSTSQRHSEDNKLDALMHKLASQGAKSLTEEERKFLALRSQKKS